MFQHSTFLETDEHFVVETKKYIVLIQLKEFEECRAARLRQRAAAHEGGGGARRVRVGHAARAVLVAAAPRQRAVLQHRLQTTRHITSPCIPSLYSATASGIVIPDALKLYYFGWFSQFPIECDTFYFPLYRKQA